jgi:hypothetical protein
MPIATNPQTGETVFLDTDGAWKPAQTAINPQTNAGLRRLELVADPSESQDLAQPH